MPLDVYVRFVGDPDPAAVTVPVYVVVTFGEIENCCDAVPTVPGVGEMEPVLAFVVAQLSAEFEPRRIEVGFMEMVHAGSGFTVTVTGDA